MDVGLSSDLSVAPATALGKPLYVLVPQFLPQQNGSCDRSSTGWVMNKLGFIHKAPSQCPAHSRGSINAGFPLLSELAMGSYIAIKGEILARL